MKYIKVISLNDMCLAEQAEYEGQYKKDSYGAYIGCYCSFCETLRGR